MLALLRQRRPDILLLIAGEGPATAALRRQASQLQLGEVLRFMGYFDRSSELNDCYNAADVFVFASLTKTQGLVLLEAMAQGVPVVAVPRMGTVDILAPLRGCRHAPLAIDGVAAAVEALLADKQALKALRTEARNYAQQWGSAHMVQRLAQLYQSLL